MAKSCADIIDETKAAKITGKNPVIFVHGLFSDSTIGSDIEKKLAHIDDAYIDHYDYRKHNFEWITHPEIAPKLAKTIICYGELSKRKDVIVVAHSMGGLATQLADSMEFEGKKVSSYLKYLIAIATPFEGSELAELGSNVGLSLCRAPAAMVSPLLAPLVTKDRCLGNLAIKGLSPKSAELNAIPPFPQSLAVKTIAGDVGMRMWTPWGDYVHDTKSDLQVSVDSAVHRYTSQYGWDGKKVYSCSGTVMIPGHSDAPCEHVRLLQLDEVHQEIKAGIEKYLAATKTPPKTPPPPGAQKTLFGKLTITYPKTWGKGNNLPGLEDVVDYSDCHGGSAVECPHISFVDLDSDFGRSTYGDPNKVTFDCYLEQGEDGHKPFESPRLQGKAPVGTEMADYYEQKVCPPYLSNQTAAIWHVKGRKVLVATEGETLGFKVSMSTLRAVLENAIWK